MAEAEVDGAASHSGWNDGDGRDYYDAVCRHEAQDADSEYYYTWNYGNLSSVFGPADIINGIVVEFYCGGETASEENNYYTITLCNSTTNRGTGKSSGANDSISECQNSMYYTEGVGFTDKWGLSQADINTYVRDNAATFGVSFIVNEPQIDGWYFEGANIHIYYTPVATGYGNIVNEVLSANIGKISEVATSDIETVNDI